MIQPMRVLEKTAHRSQEHLGPPTTSARTKNRQPSPPEPPDSLGLALEKEEVPSRAVIGTGFLLIPEDPATELNLLPKAQPK